MAKKALTGRKVQSLKAAAKGKRCRVMEALVPGFGVRVTDMGAKTYIFQPRFPGSANPARREINEASLEKARGQACLWAAPVKQGVDPAQVEQFCSAFGTAHERDELETARQRDQVFEFPIPAPSFTT